MAKKKCDAATENQCCGMKLQPLGDRVVVRRDESEERTAGGLYLPETAKNKPSRGVVVSIGDGRILDDGSRSKFAVQEGDRVLFLSYAGEDLKFGEDEFLLMRESDILAIIKWAPIRAAAVGVPIRSPSLLHGFRFVRFRSVRAVTLTIKIQTSIKEYCNG